MGHVMNDSTILLGVAEWVERHWSWLFAVSVGGVVLLGAVIDSIMRSAFGPGQPMVKIEFAKDVKKLNCILGQVDRGEKIRATRLANQWDFVLIFSYWTALNLVAWKAYAGAGSPGCWECSFAAQLFLFAGIAAVSDYSENRAILKALAKTPEDAANDNRNPDQDLGVARRATIKWAAVILACLLGAMLMFFGKGFAEAGWRVAGIVVASASVVAAMKLISSADQPVA